MIYINTQTGYKKAIIRDGELIGWRLYSTLQPGLFGNASFYGYEWIKG